MDRIKDRFFLEEIIFSLEENNIDYTKCLLRDWMAEMIEATPLTEESREDYLINVIGINEDFKPYFSSELELKNYIDG